MQKLLPLTLLLLITTISCNSATSQTTSDDTFRKVTKIVDGDTFYLEDGTQKGEKVRLIGIDSPETRNTRYKKKHPFGKVAKQYLVDLIGDQKIRLEYDVDPDDRYGRTLAYAYLEDGTFINAELIKTGHAILMTVPPNVKYADLFTELQEEARAAERGLWGIEMDVETVNQ